MPTAIGVDTLLAVLLVPAVTFALLYFPIVGNLSRALVSPYVKADTRKRLSAASVDGLIVATLVMLSSTHGSPVYLAVSAAYMLLRDSMRGQSIGKLLFGLVVVDLHTGRPCTIVHSARRNLLLLLPGANVVAIFLEARTIVVDPQGQRLGDRLAQTQVVEGAGARDLAKSFQDWLVSLGRAFGQGGDGRRRVPGQTEGVRSRHRVA
jgi:uncharacterized RDD family membrane protein YckC